MRINNIKGNFFVNGKNSIVSGEYSKKILDQFMCGLDLFSLSNIETYYAQSASCVIPTNSHPMNDGNIFLPIRSFDLKENNHYFEDLVILAYMISFVNNTKDIDSLSFIKTKYMLDQSGNEVVYRTIPMKILKRVLTDIVGNSVISFDFDKIETYGSNNKCGVFYLSTMSKDTISIQEIYRVIEYIQDVPDACEFLFYCFRRLDEHHAKFLNEIAKSDDGSFPWIKYNPFTDELYILKEYNALKLNECIYAHCEKMRQYFLHYIDSKSTFRIDTLKFLEYIKKFIPFKIFEELSYSKDLYKVRDAKKRGIKLDEVLNEIDFKILAEFLIKVMNYHDFKYLIDKFDVGVDKFNNLKIKLYKV